MESEDRYCAVLGSSPPRLLFFKLISPLAPVIAQIIWLPESDVSWPPFLSSLSSDQNRDASYFLDTVSIDGTHDHISNHGTC